MKKILTSSLSMRSRTLLRTASFLFVASSATGCVAAKEYDQARSVAESETQAHGKTRERLEAALKRIDMLQAELAAREQSLETNATAAEESKLASTVASKEKDSAMELVSELRSELARTGDHLVLFAQEKRDLQQTLLVAEERMRDIEVAGRNLSEVVAATRDLSLALKTELAQSTVELGAHDGQLVLSLPSERLFAPSGDDLTPEAGATLAAVGKVSALHPTLRVVVREPAGVSASPVRVSHLGDALRQSGVADGHLVLPATRQELPVVAAVAPVAPAAVPGDDSAPAPDIKPAMPTAAAPAAAATPLRYEIAFAP